MTEGYQTEIDEVRHGITKTAEELEKLNKKQDQGLANDKAMIDAFNKVAKQLEALVSEIKGLREDLNPTLEKVKLPPPAKTEN